MNIIAIAFCVFIPILAAAEQLATETNVGANNQLEESVDDDIYAKVFGSRKIRNIMMDFPVLLDGEKIGEVLTIVQHNTKKVHAQQVKQILSEFLLDEEVSKINQIIDQNGFVDFDKLSFLQLQTKMDMSKLNINISAPWNIKKTRDLNRHKFRDDAKPNVEPASVSGFMNTRFSTTKYSNGGGSNQNIMLTPTLNICGLVLESEINGSKYTNEQNNGYSSSNHPDNSFKFYRNYTALVYDMPDEGLRFHLGDIYSSTIDYQNVPKLFGFGFKKTNNQYNCNFENKRISLILTKKSTIEIYVNDTRVREEKNVAPGSYTISDLPFDYGSNNIKVKITDDTGRIQYLDSSYFHDSSILGFGETVYAASWGYPEVNTLENRYDRKNPLFCCNFKVGVSDSTELSIGMQRNKIGRLICYGIRDASIIGVVDISTAFSIHKENKDIIKGKAASIYYTTPSINVFGINIYAGCNAERIENLFRPYLSSVEELQDIVKQKFETQNDLLHYDSNITGKTSRIGYNVSFSDVFGCNLSLNYNLYNKTGYSRKKSISLNGSKSLQINGDLFSKGYVNLHAGKDYSKEHSSKFLSLSVSCNVKENHYISAGYYHNQTNIGSFSISNSSSEDCIVYSALVDGNSKGKNTRLFAGYNHDTCRVDINLDRRNADSYSCNTAVFGAETTLFFADGAFAIGRNRNYDGGFVIVKPTKALYGEPIKFVDNSSKAGLLCGAVTNTSAHGICFSKIDLASIPNEKNIEIDSIITKGAYKRGSVIEVSCEGSHMIKGSLVDHCGVILSLINGYAVNLNDKDMPPQQFFTNSKGTFIISNIKPGKYKAVLNVECCDDFYFEVKESNLAIVDIGKIKCGNCEKDEEKERV